MPKKVVNFEPISNAPIYEEDFMQPGGTSQQFLNAISYSVDLESLLKYKRTCSYDEAADYVPVQIEIVDPRLKAHYQGNYLLQAWGKGTKRFEIVLQYPLHSWNVQQDYLIYQMSGEEQGSEYIQIVDLKTKGAMLKVKNFWNDSSFNLYGISQQLLFVANKTSIYIIDISVGVAKGETKIIEQDPKKILFYQIDRLNFLHAIFHNKDSFENGFIMCAVETNDNQIDFVQLKIKNRKKLNQDQIEFQQTREVVSRDLAGDPVEDFMQVIGNNGDHFAVTIRQSGHVDLYYNYTLTNSCEGIRFSRIEINYWNIFLIQDGISDVKSKRIDTVWGSRIGYDVAEDYTLEAKEGDWNRVNFLMISNHVRISSSICLFPTQFFVSHNKIVSMFDVIKKKWSTHFFLEDEIYAICRNEKIIDNVRVSNLGVFLKNGLIYVIDSDIDQVVWNLMPEPKRLDGKIHNIVSDWKTINTHYILTKKKENYSIYGYSFQNLTLLNDQLHKKSVTSSMNILKMFSYDQDAHFAIIDSSQQVIYSYKNSSHFGEFRLSLQKKQKIDNFEEIQGTVHSVIQTENNKYIVLVDEVKQYKLNLEDKYIENSSVQNIQNLFVIDGNNLYKMQNQNKKVKDSKAGLYYQDISSYMDKNLECHYDIDDAIVGVNGLIDYNEDNCRFAYLTDFGEVVIVPVLHRNSICFFGMKQRSEYLVFKKVDDKLMGLDDDSQISTWSVVTGKLLSQEKVELNFDIKKLVIFKGDNDDLSYHREWYQPMTLLRETEELTNIDVKEFYDQRFLQTDIENNTTLINITNKSFYTFRMLEIVDDKQIKEHLHFVYPIYPDERYQRIHFSENLKYMIERNLNQRCFVYERVDPITPGGHVTWQIVRRILQFPIDISESCTANFLFSPDLMYYLDFDVQLRKFKIKHTLTQEVAKVIPRGIMNAKEGDHFKLVAKLFKWHDNDHIRVINEDGMEKVINIWNNWEEIAFSQVPMMDIRHYLDPNQKTHFYYQKKEASVENTYLRLKINFQDYKTAVYIQKQRKYQDLYNALFTVDFQMENSKGKPITDLSFTFLHWRMIELMTDKKKKYDMNQVGTQEMKLLVLNILPCFNTLLHYGFKRLSVIRKVYSIAQSEKRKAIKLAEKKGIEYDPLNGFLVPFIRNYLKKSPLHLALDHLSYKSADTFLENIKDEGIDNHSRAIQDALPECVEAELPSLGAYFDARFVQTKLISDLSTGCIRKENGLEYSVAAFELWPNMEDVNQRLLQKSPLDAEIILKFIDIPAMHCYLEPAGDRFFNALAGMSEIDIFAHKSLQAIIDFKWPLAKEFTIKVLFLPFIAYHLLFVLWSNIFFGQIESNDQVVLANKVISAFLIFFSCYFLINEMRQLYSNKLDYFISFWNYTDLLPPILIIVTVAYHLNDQELTIPFLATVKAVSGLLMWAKFLYFLRIFEETGYIIKILVKVIIDMRVFMLILVLVYLGYNEAFLRLSEMSDPENQFFLNYADGLQKTYTMSLGNLFVDPLYECAQPWLGFILMISFSLLTTIVMLNLLIAIISKSYEEVSENYILANYSEKAAIISENIYLIPRYKKVNFCAKNKYLIMAIEKAEDKGIEIESVPQKLNDLDNKLTDYQKVFDESRAKITNQLKNITEKMGIDKSQIL